MNESRHSGSYQTTTKYTQRCRNESRIPGRETADSLLRYQCHRFAPVMLTADQSATIINSDSIASAIMVAYELVFFHWSAFRVRNKLTFINISGVLRLENFSRGRIPVPSLPTSLLAARGHNRDIGTTTFTIFVPIFSPETKLERMRDCYMLFLVPRLQIFVATCRDC